MRGFTVPEEYRERFEEEWRKARERFQTEQILPADTLRERSAELAQTDPDFARVLEEAARQIEALADMMRRMTAGG